MCRLFALVAERSKSPELPDLMLQFREQSKQHPHGWGFGWYFGGAPQVEKSPAAAFEDPQFMTTCMSADSNIVIAHIRKSSGTPRTPENTHPFFYGDYVFAHNGSVHAKKGLRELMPKEFADRIQGQTDSEQLFYWILHNIERRGDVVQGIREAVEHVKANKGPETSAFNFVMSDGEAVYAYRSAYCKLDHYSLMYRIREETEKYPGRSIIISSQRVSRGEWHAISNDTLLVVDKLFNISTTSF